MGFIGQKTQPTVSKHKLESDITPFILVFHY